MTWKEFVYELIIAFCNERGSRSFTLREFQQDKHAAIESFSPSAKTPFNTLRRVLQELRDDGLISFVDNSGTYTLRGIDLLDIEKDEIKTIDLSREEPEKKEYLLETYVRRVGWARKARETFGSYCMVNKCHNTFTKEDGTPYIEVHHIIPLFRGGEDSLWNLSVLCAHHHRMAHYADTETKSKLEKTLLEKAQCML